VASWSSTAAIAALEEAALRFSDKDPRIGSLQRTLNLARLAYMHRGAGATTDTFAGVCTAAHGTRSCTS